MTAALAPGSQQFREMVVGEALRAAESAARLQLRIARVDLDFDIADPDVGAALLPALSHHDVLPALSHHDVLPALSHHDVRMCYEAGIQIVGDDYAAVELAGAQPRAWNRSMKVGERDHSPGGFDHRWTLIDRAVPAVRGLTVLAASSRTPGVYR